MKRIFQAFLIVGALSLCARADVEVSEVASSSYTVHVVVASSGAASQMDPSSVVMPMRESIEIQNIDASATLWCSQLANVAVNAGHKIAAGASWILNIRARGITGAAMNVYCISDSASGGTNAAITQAY